MKKKIEFLVAAVLLLWKAACYKDSNLRFSNADVKLYYDQIKYLNTNLKAVKVQVSSNNEQVALAAPAQALIPCAYIGNDIHHVALRGIAHGVDYGVYYAVWGGDIRHVGHKAWKGNTLCADKLYRLKPLYMRVSEAVICKMRDIFLFPFAFTNINIFMNMFI